MIQTVYFIDSRLILYVNHPDRSSSLDQSLFGMRKSIPFSTALFCTS